MFRPTGMYRKALSGLKNYNEKINTTMQSFSFPERFKGTVLEKWKDYWINLLMDYRDVAKDTIVTAKTTPRKTAAILSLFGFGTYCFRTNPDEINYRDAFLSYSSEFMLVAPAIRNPAAKKYLEEIEMYYNEGVIHRLSFGFFSIMWKDSYNDHLGLYRAHCSFLKVPFYEFNKQIIDVGFMNKWYILNREMIDYDINPYEWTSET